MTGPPQRQRPSQLCSFPPRREAESELFRVPAPAPVQGRPAPGAGCPARPRIELLAKSVHLCRRRPAALVAATVRRLGSTVTGVDGGEHAGRTFPRPQSLAAVDNGRAELGSG
eukprot:scaffold136218_cov148-Phaeocystis_antarctica.AAC.1